MRYSPLFYGWYDTKKGLAGSYETPLAYFLAMMAVYILSFILILRKMAKNNKQSKLTEKVNKNSKRF
jgi:transmembrane channel-like protein